MNSIYDGVRLVAKSKKKCAQTTIAVCMGGGCVDKKAKRLHANLKELVKERGLSGKIDVTKTGCVGKCGKGPHVIIMPCGKHLTHVKPTQAAQVLDKACGE